MRHTDALAQVYARSLYELARDAGGEQKILEVGGELEQICELSRRDRTFREFLASPIIDIDRRRDSLRAMFNDRVTDLTLRFLLVLNNKRRLSHLEHINTAYDQLVQEAFGRVEVDVITTEALDETERQAIQDRVRAALGKEPVIHSYTEPDMLGGIKLRIGDQLIDGSLARDLRQLKHELLSNGANRVRESLNRIIGDDPAAS